MFGLRCCLALRRRLPPRDSPCLSAADEPPPPHSSMMHDTPCAAPAADARRRLLFPPDVSDFAPPATLAPASLPPPIGEYACCPPDVSRTGGDHWRVAKRRFDKREAGCVLGGCCCGVSARRRARPRAGAPPTRRACITRRAPALCAASRPRRLRSAGLWQPKTLCSAAGRAAGGRRDPTAARQLTCTASLRRRGRQLMKTSCSARFGSCTPSATCRVRL